MSALRFRQRKWQACSTLRFPRRCLSSRLPCWTRRCPRCLRRRTTLLFNAPFTCPGFLGNLWLAEDLPGRRRLVLRRRAPLVLLAQLRSSPRLLLLLASLARRGRTARVRRLFPHPLEAPVTPEVKEKAPGRSPLDGMSLPLRVGGCLAPHWRRWQAVGAESWVMSVLRDGYRVPFKDSPPPLSRTPVSFLTYRADSPRAQALWQEVEAMLAKGALEIALNLGPGFYSRLFLVEKASGGWQPVISLSHLNEFVQLTPFKMETVAFVLLSVREGDFLASLDLKDAYFQIPIHPSSRKLLRFTLEGTVYQFRACVSDCRPLPRSLPGSSQPCQRGLTRTGSDFFGTWTTSWFLPFGAGSQAGGPVPALTLSHPWDCDKREEERSCPLADCEVPRHTIDTEAGKVFPSLAQVEKFLTVAESFCSMASPTAQLWQVILGHLASLERLVPHGRLRMCSLQWHLKVHWSPETDPPSLPVPLPQEARRDLSWWMVKDYLLTGVRFGSPASDLHLYSDASCSRWGAHLLDQRVSGVKALFLALQAFREDVIGHHVTVMCDNSTVVTYVNKQGGMVSRALCSLTSRLLRWMESLDIHLDVRYLPGQSNVLADLLSHRGQVVGIDWSLHPQVTRSLFPVWGNPSIDRFATSLNAKLPLYCSLVPDPQAVFEDAFRHPWDDLDVYAFPPFPLVSRVVACVRESSRLAMTLVAPLWPGKEWFADLLLLLTQPPLALPWWDSLLRKPHCNLFHQNVHALNLHAWRLSSDTSESQAFREGLLMCCQGVSDPPPRTSTSRGGRSFVVGVVEGALLQSTPLYP